MSENTEVEVAVKSASYNIILQVLMRILSSLSNAVILRFITKDALGVVNVRLMLLYTTCQFFSREAFRRSCLSKLDKINFQRKINLLWLGVPTALMFSSILGYIWIHIFEQPDSSLVLNYNVGVYIVMFSVLSEMVAEPLYVFSQSFNFVKLKVIVEGLSQTVKSISMVILLWFFPHHPIYAFCISQCLYSAVTISVYYAYYWWYFSHRYPRLKEQTLPIQSVSQILPKFSLNFVDSQDFYLAWTFLKQTLLKQLLTEGERYIMTIFNVMSFAEQGLYDVVSNLGSLSARFVLLPIEDSGYLLFTKLLSREKKENSQKNIDLCFEILEKLLKLMLLLGLMILMFGYSYSQLLLLLYGGPALSSKLAVTLLRWHCGYVLLLALNGITEGFKFAVMSQQQLDKYNTSMVVLSSAFLLAAYCLVKCFGGVGFIMANCFNMTLRILHSMYFILQYFKKPLVEILKTIIPHGYILIVLICSMAVTSISEVYFCCDQGFKLWMWHLLIGMACFFYFLIVVYKSEPVIVGFIYEQFKRKKH